MAPIYPVVRAFCERALPTVRAVTYVIVLGSGLTGWYTIRGQGRLIDSMLRFEEELLADKVTLQNEINRMRGNPAIKVTHDDHLRIAEILKMRGMTAIQGAFGRVGKESMTIDNYDE